MLILLAYAPSYANITGDLRIATQQRTENVPSFCSSQKPRAQKVLTPLIVSSERVCPQEQSSPSNPDHQTLARPLFLPKPPRRHSRYSILEAVYLRWPFLFLISQAAAAAPHREIGFHGLPSQNTPREKNSKIMFSVPLETPRHLFPVWLSENLSRGSTKKKNSHIGINHLSSRLRFTRFPRNGSQPNFCFGFLST